jgi:S-adenosylmethionine:tRNA ribosyltransferase-isomerase
MTAMTLDDRTFDFELPPELEAHEPAEKRGRSRDDVRLMISSGDGSEIRHARFADLPRFLSAGDLLVLNTTATLPAALRARRENGEEIALHYSTSLPGGLAVVEPRHAEVDAGDLLALPGGGRARLLVPYRDSSRLWIAQLAISEPIAAYLRRWGRPITYPYVNGRFGIDAYQTVFAEVPGSAEMPSAGRAFTRPMLACLRRSGVRLAKLVLHTGVASLERHERPYEEWYEVPARTAELVRKTHLSGGRVIAVGTTVVRALESSVDRNGQVIASSGWTDLVVDSSHEMRAVDGLLTGLHEPRASHLRMLEAIAGRQHVAAAYRQALSHGYLWHEFGDLHLILPSPQPAMTA